MDIDPVIFFPLPPSSEIQCTRRGDVETGASFFLFLELQLVFGIKDWAGIKLLQPPPPPSLLLHVLLLRCNKDPTPAAACRIHFSPAGMVTWIEGVMNIWTNRQISG
jgi:hypothetical protein